VIVAVAAAVALTTSREVLTQRWLHANRAHSIAWLAPGPGAATPPPDLSALAGRELAIAGRYQLADSPPALVALEPLWSRAWDWLRARWLPPWNALFARVHVGNRTVTSVGDALLGLVTLLLLFAGFRILRSLHLERSRSRLPYQPIVMPPDPRRLYDDACEAADRGDYGRAALQLFGAIVALLDNRGVIHSSRSATVGELRRELRASDAALISPFDAIAALFVRKAYAERPVDATGWDRARGAFAALLEERTQP
jgi:hypothetical protein